MGLTKPFNRMNGSVFNATSEVPANLTVGTYITIAGVTKEVVSTGEDETVNSNKLRNVAPGRKNVRAKSTNYSVQADDDGAVIKCDSSFTVSLPAAALLPNGWFVDVISVSGDVVIDPNGAEVIDGASTVTLSSGQDCRITCNGSAFYSQFLSNTRLENIVEDATPQLGGALDANGNSIDLSQGADVASAAELLVLRDGNSFDVTGAVTISSIEDTADAWPIGSVITLKFDDAPLLAHHATNLVLLGGADIQTAAGDVAIFQKYAAGDWRMVSFSGISATTGWQAGTSTKPSLASPANIAASIGALQRSPAPDLMVSFETTSGTAGTSGIPAALTLLPLNTVNRNVIAGVSLASNVITGLPAGDYYIEWLVNFRRAGASTALVQTDIYDNLAAARAVPGISDQIGSYDAGVIAGAGFYSPAATADLILRGYSNSSGTTNGAPTASGSPNVINIVKLWKL